MKVLPFETLPTAVTEGLVFPFHRYSTLRADRKTGNAVRAAETTELCYRHRLPKGQFLPDRGRDQQVIWG